MQARTSRPPRGRSSMRRTCLLVATVALLVGGCAAFDTGPPPLTRADVVQLTRTGETPSAIIGRLQSTQTVLALSASDIVDLRQAGVAIEVLDYLQAAQLAELADCGGGGAGLVHGVVVLASIASRYLRALRHDLGGMENSPHRFQRQRGLGTFSQADCFGTG